MGEETPCCGCRRLRVLLPSVPCCCCRRLRLLLPSSAAAAASTQAVAPWVASAPRLASAPRAPYGPLDPAQDLLAQGRVDPGPTHPGQGLLAQGRGRGGNGVPPPSRPPSRGVAFAFCKGIRPTGSGGRSAAGPESLLSRGRSISCCARGGGGRLQGGLFFFINVKNNPRPRDERSV